MKKEDFRIAMYGGVFFKTYAEYLRELGFDVISGEPLHTESECIDSLQSFDGVVAFGEPYNEKVFAAIGDKLKIIARFGLGYDAIDLSAASKYGICVTNTAGTMASGVAETAFLLMLDCGRRFSKYDAKLHSGKWRKDYVGSELEGKTVGIVGLGSIGGKLAQYCMGFHCKLIAYDINMNKDLLMKHDIEYVSLNELARRADYISIHCPATPETNKLIDEKFLSMMKQTAFLINTSRGTVVDEKALVVALKHNIIAGAGLDVYETEPLKGNSELRGLENVTLLPHIASSTHESMLECTEDIAKSLETFIDGKLPVHCLNTLFLKRSPNNKEIYEYDH